jgi:molybdenum cofactor cytidylyltransferase
VLRTDDPHRSARAWSAPTFAIAAADAERGLGASIAAATQQLSDQQSVLICLADMPYIKPESYRAIADAMSETTPDMRKPRCIVVPVYRGKRGHPVAFSSHYLPELRQLDGDQGARDLLLRHRDHVKEIAVDDPGIHRDIDTVADLLIGL